MSNNRFRILFTLLLTASLALTVLPSAFSVPMNGAAAWAAAPTSGLSVYNENFTTTTYRAGATSASGWGTGAVTSLRDYSVVLLDFYNTTDPARGVEVQGRNAYVVTHPSVNNALRILDLTNPRAVTLVGARSSVSTLLAVAVEGDVAYVGSVYLTGVDYCWLATYNVTNPYSIPAPLDTLTFSDGNITDLDVQGHFLYVAIQDSSGDDFTIVDVENPADIRTVGGIGYSTLYGLDIEGQLAYLADGLLGLYIRNVTNPYSTTSVGARDTPGNCTDVLVDGGLAYVADWTAGVQILDVSHPSNPIILGRYDTPGEAQRLALQGDTLFVADGSGGLQVVDVANPAHPCNVTAVTLPYTYDVALYGREVVAATVSGIYTLRIAKGLTSLPLTGSYSGGYKFWDVRVQGDIAYVAAGPDGLLTFNVSDPANPVLLDEDVYGSAPFYRKLDVQGAFVYVANYFAAPDYYGFIIYDASDPANLRRLDTMALSYPTDVAVAGDVAWVADGTFGVYCFNVSNPYSITTIDNWGGLGNVTSLWVQGYHLYVATETAGGQGLLIYDIRDISSSTLVFSWSPVATDHYDVLVDGDALYLADGLGYVVVWNVTNPFTAYYTDWIHYSSEKPTSVWSFGPYLLAGLYGKGIDLINTTDIYNLAVMTSHLGPKAALHLTVHGDYAYVANYTSLVIHRLFQSAGATYVTAPSIAESLTVDATSEVIVNATLSPAAFFPTFTGLTWQLSADGGAHWEAVTPGVLHTFTNTGSDLRWRATFTTGGHDDRSVHLYGVSITYGHTVITTLPPPIPGFPAAAIALGAVLSLGLVLALRQRKQRKQ